MGVFKQLGLLLWKYIILRKRQPVSRISIIVLFKADNHYCEHKHSLKVTSGTFCAFCAINTHANFKQVQHITLRDRLSEGVLLHFALLNPFSVWDEMKYVQTKGPEKCCLLTQVKYSEN